jgi:hypothetical protein
MKLRQAFLILTIGLFFVACEKKVKAPAITEWTQYQDPFFRVTFSYPKGWHLVGEPHKVILYSSQESMQKFFDPTFEGAIGAQIIITGERDSLSNLSKYVATFESDKKAEQFEIQAKKEITVDSLAANEFQYSGQFDPKTRLTAIRTFVLKDSTIYYVHYGAYNELFEPYRVVYDSVIASLVLPKRRVVAKNVDPSIPVAEMSKFSNEILDITYPENYSPTIAPSKGEVQFEIQIKARYRQDSFIAIDVRPAKKLSLEKVVEQNSKNFKNVGSKGSANIGGEKAAYLNYSPTKGVDGRAYFIVKNDKFYRVIMFYPTQLKKDFLPAFEKTVASLRLK